ncbi:hypothetical protein PsYK624_042890 [Phanerochaete sordida]|uniref:BTB domain-containing protein n=1 Tax=Phanerochaete sordida TaxID=48140 RepID=A0A9P3G4M8_9APHY|nr:hypothetical protein PsYK624_042890 [Phanerochaete sordida]
MSAPQTRSAHAKKRKLAAAGSSVDSVRSSDAALVRDEHIWFEDGFIIIRAGPGCAGEGPVYGFRCHGSVLAARSPVFKIMLQLPTPAHERLEGASCVNLPDSWEDVRDLLRLLYDFVDLTCLGQKQRHSDTLKIISGPLRMAAKYDMESVTKQLTPFLTRDWPSSPGDWLEFEGTLEPAWERQRPQDPAAVVRLAQDVRLRAVLPAAFYELSRSFLRRPPYQDLPDNCADSSLLTRDDLERLAVGRERIQRFVTRDVVQSLRRELELYQIDGADVLCENMTGRAKTPCIAHLLGWWNIRVAMYMEELVHDPLRTLELLSSKVRSAGSDQALRETCGGCRGWCSRFLIDSTFSLWGELPKFFELDSLPF